MISLPLRRILRPALLALSLALPMAPGAALAQASEALVQEYVQLPAVQQMIADMFAPETMTQQIAATLPPGVQLSDAQLSQIGAIMSDELNGLRPQMETVMANATARYFTDAEVEAMIAFYSSPEGASILAKTQPMFTEIMAQIQPEMMRRIGSRQGEIMQIMLGQ